MPAQYIRAVTEARFWAKVCRDGPAPTHCPDLGPCWLWMASLQPNGYGIFSTQNPRVYGAHRMSWTLAFGPIPDGLHVLHRCDVRHCVRPAHLFLGTPADNMRDMQSKGRKATGGRNGARLHPERLPRGEVHPARIDPSYLARGERQGSAKLTADDVVAIRVAYADGARLVALADRFGVTEGAILNAIRGTTWAHIGGADPTASPRRRHATSRQAGVDWHARGGKWRARVRINGQDRHLGLFATEEEAAAAIDAVRGEAQ